MTPACKATVDYINTKMHLTPEPGFLPTEIPGVGRWWLSVLFKELGFTRGAEIGVEEGVYSEQLCKANPGLHLIAVDAWKSHKGYRDHTNQEKLDGFYATTKARLSPYNCDIRRGFSMDVVKTIKDDSLDFVYIDANHAFQPFTNDLSEWSRKVRDGGIVSGHDYIVYRRAKNSINCHVVQVTHAYTDAYEISPWYVLGSKEIKDGAERDRPRSWMWVNGAIPPLKRGWWRD